VAFDQIQTFAENWFRPRLEEDRITFPRTVQSKLGEFEARGTILSSPCYMAVENLVEQEIEKRGKRAFEGYERALKALGGPVAPSTISRIKRELESTATEESVQAHGVIQYVRQAVKPTRFRDATQLCVAPVKKLLADVDLLCATLNNSQGRSATKVKRLTPAKRPKRPARTEKQVWQEAGSRCVFCPERDVSALQVHHIDSNPTNNAFENLILACATCHAKITAGVFSEAEVITRKRELQFRPQDSLAASSSANAGNVSVDRTINTGTIAHTIKFEKSRAPRMHYPQGTIGSDPIRKNYIDYLIKRYFDWRKADASYGSRRPFSHAVIHTNIQKDFGAKTFFVLVERFDGLADYLQRKIDNTILGRNKRSKGERRYKSFTDYQAEQLSGPG
jgi:5-methylcytosine-specific restriction endonuclease McrA